MYKFKRGLTNFASDVMEATAAHFPVKSKSKKKDRQNRNEGMVLGKLLLCWGVIILVQ